MYCIQNRSKQKRFQKLLESVSWTEKLDSDLQACGLAFALFRPDTRHDGIETLEERCLDNDCVGSTVSDSDWLMQSHSSTDLP